MVAYNLGFIIEYNFTLFLLEGLENEMVGQDIRIKGNHAIATCMTYGAMQFGAGVKKCLY